MSVGGIVREWRSARGWTLGALALRAEVDKATLSRWESGKTLPRIEELERTLTALRVPHEDRERCLHVLPTPRAQRRVREKAAAAAADNGGVAAKLPVGRGEMLRALRLRAEKTQAETAREIGVSPALLSRWEQGDCAPDGDRIRALCICLEATAEETALLSAPVEQWQPVVLPQDKDALDAAVRDLIAFEPTPHLDLTFLALAGRYHTLYKNGKIGYHEAAGIWGHFGDFVTWRHGRIADGARYATAALQSLADQPSDRPFADGHWAAFLTLPYGEDLAGRPENAIALIDRHWNRFAPQQKISMHVFRGNSLFRMGAVEEGITAYRYAIDHAPDEIADFIWRQVCSENLSRAGRYEDALRILVPPSPSETRASVLDGHWMTRAWALAGIREKGEAERLYQQTRPGIGNDISPILRVIVEPVEVLLDR